MRDEAVRKIVEKFARSVLTFSTWFINYVERHPNKERAAAELAEAKVLLARLKGQIEESEDK